MFIIPTSNLGLEHPLLNLSDPVLDAVVAHPYGVGHVQVGHRVVVEDAEFSDLFAVHVQQQLLSRHRGHCRLQGCDEVERNDLAQTVIEQEVERDQEEKLGEHREWQVATKAVQVVLEKHVGEGEESVTDQEGLVDQLRIGVPVEGVG